MHAFELDACAMRAGCAGDPALGYELRQFSVSAGGAGTDPLGTAGLTRTRNAGSTYAVRACGNGAEAQFGDRGEIISEPGYPQQHISERCGVYRRRFPVAGQQRRGKCRVGQLVGVRQRGSRDA